MSRERACEGKIKWISSAGDVAVSTWEEVTAVNNLNLAATTGDKGGRMGFSVTFKGALSMPQV